jgi:hypothetical protein
MTVNPERNPPGRDPRRGLLGPPVLSEFGQLHFLIRALAKMDGSRVGRWADGTSRGL